eukprot:TRINITY_DN18533_c0_g2_i1.p1 TRINITY_DN18533_c0_g2~~TRINITY_DN18533_c0_g2_i1.p1  ORF type:complete len:169 (-),score=4.51 TRINITY_DN18533_c0_g2_i1:236-742(-)
MIGSMMQDPRPSGSDSLYLLSPTSTQCFRPAEQRAQMKDASQRAPSRTSYHYPLSPSTSQSSWQAGQHAPMYAESPSLTSYPDVSPPSSTQCFRPAQQHTQSRDVPPRAPSERNYHQSLTPSAQSSSCNETPPFCYECGKTRLPMFSFCQWCGIRFPSNASGAYAGHA